MELPKVFIWLPWSLIQNSRSMSYPAWLMTLAMESPSAAQRPWPTCMGPTGLADTNSIWVFRPPPTLERAKSMPCSRASPKMAFTAAAPR